MGQKPKGMKKRAFRPPRPSGSPPNSGGEEVTSDYHSPSYSPKTWSMSDSNSL